MSEISAENSPGAESVPETSGETSQADRPLIFSQMQENITKMTQLVADLQQELKGEDLPQQNPALDEQSNNNLALDEHDINSLDLDAIKKERLKQHEEFVMKMSQFKEESDKTLLQLEAAVRECAAIQSRFEQHELTRQQIVQELQQHKINLEKEAEDLKVAMAFKEMAGLGEVEELDNEIADLSMELADLYNRVNKMIDATTCPLCLAPWDNAGSHRVVTMRCGHLFGSNCLRECIRFMGKCPICGIRARQNDVRNIYYGGQPD